MSTIVPLPIQNTTQIYPRFIHQSTQSLSSDSPLRAQFGPSSNYQSISSIIGATGTTGPVYTKVRTTAALSSLITNLEYQLNDLIEQSTEEDNKQDQKEQDRIAQTQLIVKSKLQKLRKELAEINNQ
jgi:hypothetical protein